MNPNDLITKASDFLTHFRKPFIRAIEVFILIACTVIIYTLLLYFAKHLWIVFNATDVGQKYAEFYQDSYRVTQDLLGRDFIRISIDLTLTSLVICFLAGAIFKFLHIIQFCYSARGFLSRIIFIALPLTYIVSIFLHYTGTFSHRDTAYVVAFVPTLFLFSGCFNVAEEFVPEFMDVVSIFSRPLRSNGNGGGEPERSVETDQIKKIVQPATVSNRKTDFYSMWKSYAAYFIVTLIIIAVAVILFIIAQTFSFHKIEKKEVAVTFTAKEHKSILPNNEIRNDGRFIAYADKTVLDTKTGLMWASEESEPLNWQEAKRYCKNFRGGGYSDWRMPSMHELEELYDPNMQPDCGCVTHLIEMYNGANCWEWSSETRGSDAAFLAFNLNGRQWLPQSNNSSVHIRPVRTHN